MELRNRRLVITGGTSGIGLALVEQLAPRNRSVILVARNSARLHKLAQTFPNLVTYPCDLSQKHEVVRCFTDIAQAYADISVVINNAAVQFTPEVTDENFSFDSIETEIAINLCAPVWITALMIKPLLALNKPAALVNINSGLAICPKKSSAVYSATKAGLRHFSHALSYQLEATQVGVHNLILPLVDTPMTHGRGAQKMTAQAAATAIIKGIETGQREIYIGKSRWLPLLARISPGLLASIMKTL